MKSIKVLESAMTIEAARKVNWNRQNPRPMGELLNEGFLNKEDLEWAAQNAFNPLQKQAAQVLLGHSRADVTQVYAERNEELAATVAAKIG